MFRYADVDQSGLDYLSGVGLIAKQGVNLPKYLERIQHGDSVVIDDTTLTALHVCHVHHVPFENLDVRDKRLFDLNIESIYRKVVDNNRGGFCYELNLLFNELLNVL